ncbi:hypothetical protein MKZ38_005773 [Zalerion maritima]|uniref:Response regulatory domain-containing protein n=1 Tax=Zalerion maritima TaxID=339359 RepID=A0AAD5RQ52_9PEZI|nr:hypothetical protein MKZ38_005773 [Zalerion maritima]
MRPSSLIIDGVTQHDKFRDHSVVKSHPSLRFCAAMPVITKSGFDIGTLAVTDGTPSKGPSDVEIMFLGDMRSDKMIRGLAAFAKGRSVAGERRRRKQGAARRGRTMEPEVAGLPISADNHSHNSPPPKPLGVASTKSNASSAVESSPTGKAERDNDKASAASESGSPEIPFLRPPIPTPSETPVPSREENLQSPDSKQSSARFSPDLKDVFSGDSHNTPAAREQMAEDSQGSEGSNWARRCSQSSTGDAESSEVSSGSSGASPQSESAADGGGRDENQNLCKVLGFSSGDKPSLHGNEDSTFVPLAESFLQYLLRHMFHTRGRGPAMSTTDELGNIVEGDAKSTARRRKAQTHSPKYTTKRAEAHTLLRMLVGAQRVAFVPLSDSHRERCYLAAFGNCIMAEAAQLGAVAADHAKSDFISSISHELRSPPHSILASSEFLQDTAVDLFQQNFAKINNSTRLPGNGEKGNEPSKETARSGMLAISVVMDIRLITEDEVSGFPPEGLRRSSGNQSSTSAEHHKESKKQRLEVTLDLDWRLNWIFNIQSGALRRVLMNLFGSALKYTPSRTYGSPRYMSESGDMLNEFWGEHKLPCGCWGKDMGFAVNVNFKFEAKEQKDECMGANNNGRNSVCSMEVGLPSIQMSGSEAFQGRDVASFMSNQLAAISSNDTWRGNDCLGLSSRLSVFLLGISGCPEYPTKHKTLTQPESDFSAKSPSEPSETLATITEVTADVEILKPLLLLVEGNQINLKLFGTSTLRNNYKYDTTENGLVAFQAFQKAQKAYDIIFMDLSMSVMGGMEATWAVRQLKRERGQKPAIIIAWPV